MQRKEDDDQVANIIRDKMGDTPGVSYSDIASKALECGREELAIRVSEFECSANVLIKPHSLGKLYTILPVKNVYLMSQQELLCKLFGLSCFIDILQGPRKYLYFLSFWSLAKSTICCIMVNLEFCFHTF